MLLVCMPFGPVFSPSFGLSLLQAGLARAGVASRVRYFSIDFAQRVGQHFYSGIATESRPTNRDLAGEWIFAPALFGSNPERDTAYVEEVLRRHTTAPEVRGEPPASDALVRRIVAARSHVEPFLDACLVEIVAQRPRLVGFTSIFQQHVASLALARRIKAALPDTFVVMGGANCEGPMGAETLRQFPFVDAIVSGEADQVFPEFVRRVLAGQDVAGLVGVRTPATVAAEFASGQFPAATMVGHMDDLPYPDYQDYFEQFDASRYAGDWQPSLYFETSRGCWWGERQHCTFCGLNGQSMAYRSKSPQRALDELEALVAKHPGSDVQVVDNILDLGYFDSFLPELAKRKLPVSLFYETKSNLKKDQVRALRDAGITRVQPGIESLSDAVLKRMRKGVSALQNVQLLKWCHEIGVEPHWNVLWGFAGEPPAEYGRMAQVVPWLTHLQPPTGFGTVRIDRFSPNFFDAARQGFVDVKPTLPYRLVYDLPDVALANLAYYFTYDYRLAQDVAAYTSGLARELRAWKQAARHSALFSVPLADTLIVWDQRPAARTPLLVLDALARRLYEACDAASIPDQVVRALAQAGIEVSADEVEQRLAPLVERGLVLRDGRRYLALAVPLGERALGPAVSSRFRETARHLGAPIRGGGGVRVPLVTAATGLVTAVRPPSRRSASQDARPTGVWGRRSSVRDGAPMGPATGSPRRRNPMALIPRFARPDAGTLEIRWERYSYRSDSIGSSDAARVAG